MKTKTKLGLLSLVILLLLVWLFWPEKPTPGNSKTEPVLAAESHSSEDNVYAKFKKARDDRRIKRYLLDEEALAQGLPRGDFEYVFDKAKGANRFLLAKGRDQKFVPDSDAPSGMDMWLQDESGKERLVNGSVYRAKFSPDGSKIAFTTSDCVLHVEDINGGKVAEVPGAYSANWKPDGSAVIFSKIGEGQKANEPGTRQLAALDLATGQMKPLTDGNFDDGRPEFNPSSEWVLFVSGSRTGLASFWSVPAEGGEPVQLTNQGLEEVNDQFVPTPYDKTLWSGNKHWFLYDFKSGDRQETWGLEFNADGTMKKAAKLAEGLNPRWKEDGRTFVCERNVDGTIQTIVSHLP